MRNGILNGFCSRTAACPAQLRHRSKGIRLASAFAGILAILVGFFSSSAARAANLKPLFARITAAVVSGSVAKPKA